MSEDTYEIPKHGWTCFHCGENFKTVGAARDHFGAAPDALPGCIIKVQLGAERGLLMALRNAEDEIARHAEEDTALHRAYLAATRRASSALEDAEILGYERGLRAGRNEPKESDAATD